MTDESCWRILENVSNLIYMLMVCWDRSASVADFLILLQLGPLSESEGDKSLHFNNLWSTNFGFGSAAETWSDRKRKGRR